MTRTIIFNTGIISGYDKELISSILPDLEHSFKQRKTYHEYYFNQKVIDLDLDTLEVLSSEYRITLNLNDLIIHV